MLSGESIDAARGEMSAKPVAPDDGKLPNSSSAVIAIAAKAGRLQSAWGVDVFLSLLHLDAAQEFAMLDANKIDVVEGRLRSMFPDLAIRLNVEKHGQFLCCQIAAAHAAGIASTNDTILYCGLAILHGENFSEISPWREI